MPTNPIVIQLISNSVWGGGERYARDLSARLRADGITVAAVTRGVEAVDSELDAIGVPHVSAPFGGFTDIRTPRIIARMVMNLPADNPVVLHAHDFKNAFLAIQARNILRRKGRRSDNVRVVVTRHLIRRAKKDLVNRYIYRNIDSLIFISRAVQNEFLSGFPDFPEEKYHLVYNGIYNPGKKTGLQQETNRSDNASTVNVTFMGRLNPEKGVDMLLKALAMMESADWHAIVCGTGEPEYVESLRNLSAALGIADKVEWCGFVNDIDPILKRTDIGVVPSVCREAFGLTILEFASHAIPVVATDADGPKEILTSGRDSILAEVNPEAFSKALEKLISDPSMRQKLGEAAKATSLRFDYENSYRAILGVYNAVD